MHQEKSARVELVARLVFVFKIVSRGGGEGWGQLGPFV